MTIDEAVAMISVLVATSGTRKDSKALRVLLAEREQAQKLRVAAEEAFLNAAKETETAEAQLRETISGLVTAEALTMSHEGHITKLEARLRDMEAQVKQAEILGDQAEQELEQAEARLREMENESLAENHAIFTLTGVPRDGYTLQQEIRARLEEAQAEVWALRELLRESWYAMDTRQARAGLATEIRAALARQEAPQPEEKRPEPPKAQIIDLMGALKASLAAHAAKKAEGGER